VLVLVLVLVEANRYSVARYVTKSAFVISDISIFTSITTLCAL
jgi:hypothetical protein